jgi:hypothetical protein
LNPPEQCGSEIIDLAPNLIILATVSSAYAKRRLWNQSHGTGLLRNGLYVKNPSASTTIFPQWIFITGKITKI